MMTMMMMNPNQTIAAQLERIEAKLDLVLEKLKWAPESMAGWYAEIAQSGPQEAEPKRQ